MQKSEEKGSYKRCNIIGIPQGDVKENITEDIFKVIITENFPN